MSVLQYRSLLHDVGQYLGRMNTVLDGVDHPGAHREHMWDVANTDGVRGFVQCITDDARRALVVGVLDEFCVRVKPRLAELRHGLLQADFNDANIVLAPDNQSVGGVIDFGDCVHSARVFDVAICMAYAMLSSYGKLGPKEGLVAAQSD